MRTERITGNEPLFLLAAWVLVLTVIGAMLIAVDTRRLSWRQGAVVVLDAELLFAALLYWRWET